MIVDEMNRTHKKWLRTPRRKKLIDELSTEDLNFEENVIGTESGSVLATENDVDSVNFLNLYDQLINAENSNQKAFHAVIRVDYNFGHLKKRREYYTRLVLVIMRLEVSTKELSDNALRKKQMARKVYDGYWRGQNS